MKINAESFKAKQESFKEEIRKEGEKLVKETLRQFFEDNPQVIKLRWTQYTPYFNDGDECVFGVCSPYVLMKEKENVKEEDLEGGDYDDGFLSEYDLKKDHPAISDDLKDLENLLNVAQESLKMAFGDHARITATKDKIDVEEYEHD